MFISSTLEFTISITSHNSLFHFLQVVLCGVHVWQQSWTHHGWLLYSTLVHWCTQRWIWHLVFRLTVNLLNSSKLILFIMNILKKLSKSIMLFADFCIGSVQIVWVISFEKWELIIFSDDFVVASWTTRRIQWTPVDWESVPLCYLTRSLHHLQRCHSLQPVDVDNKTLSILSMKV